MADAEKPGRRYWSEVKPFWNVIGISAAPDEFVRQFRAAPPVAGHLFAAHWCQSEVRNGGLRQFFSNPTGVLAPEALAAFRTIGLTEWADILAEAMRFFDEPYPREQAVRRQLLPRPAAVSRAKWDPFFALDERFYSWLHAEPDRWEQAADRFAESAATTQRRPGATDG